MALVQRRDFSGNSFMPETTFQFEDPNTGQITSQFTDTYDPRGFDARQAQINQNLPQVQNPGVVRDSSRPSADPAIDQTSPTVRPLRTATSTGAQIQPVPEFQNNSNTRNFQGNRQNPLQGFDQGQLMQSFGALFSLLGPLLFGTGGGKPPEESIDETAVGGSFNDFVSDLTSEVEKYVEELRGEARGDYDFAIKWLNKNHELALGQDDQARAKFFEQVADKFEEKVGRIPYDYFQKTDREKQDLMDFLRNQNREEEDRIARQTEFNKQQEFLQGVEQDQTNQEFNSRGLLNSGIQKKQEMQQDERRQLFEQDPFARAQQLEADRRAFQTQRGVLDSGRRLEDITTSARRAGVDSENQLQFGSEQSQRELDKRLAAIQREESASKRQAQLLGQDFIFGA